MTMRLPPNYISRDWVYRNGQIIYTYKQYIIARNARKDILAHDDITLFDTVRGIDDYHNMCLKWTREIERRYYH